MSKIAAKSGKQAPIKPSIATSILVPTAANLQHNGHGAGLDDVRLAAYLKWEASGKPDCDGTAFWLEAEQESRTAH